jgi:hypothetical protein
VSTTPTPMPDQSQDTDQDASGYEKCEQEIESLETRVAAIEKKLGMTTPDDEQEPDALTSAIQGNSNPFLKATTR